ncbi:MAG: DUF6263 family protein [Planctomycetota bacterium]|jgi:hypothetical protein
MRSVSITLLFTALLLLALGCGGDDKGAGSGKGGKAAKTPSKPSFKYRFDPGTTVRFRTTTEMEMGGMMAMKQNQVQEQTWTAKEPDEEGNSVLEITYDVVKFHMEHPMMGNVDYDSSTADPNDEPNPLAAGAAAFVGEKVTLTVSPDGEVKSVSGFNAIVEKMIKDNPMGEMMKGMLSDETMKSQMQGFMGKLPNKDMGVGDEWKDEITTQGPMMGTITMNITNKVKSIDEVDGVTIGVIESSAVIDMSSLKLPGGDDPDDPMAAMLSQIKISEGKLTGEMKFDMTNGQIVMNRAVTTMTMEMMGQQSDVKTVMTTERID